MPQIVALAERGGVLSSSPSATSCTSLPVCLGSNTAPVDIWPNRRTTRRKSQRAARQDRTSAASLEGADMGLRQLQLRQVSYACARLPPSSLLLATTCTALCSAQTGRPSALFSRNYSWPSLSRFDTAAILALCQYQTDSLVPMCRANVTTGDSMRSVRSKANRHARQAAHL